MIIIFSSKPRGYDHFFLKKGYGYYSGVLDFKNVSYRQVSLINIKIERQIFIRFFILYVKINIFIPGFLNPLVKSLLFFPDLNYKI